jgi:hypothetical protein
MPPNQVLLAAGAGVASALLFTTLVTGSLGAIILAYLAPLPVFAAGLALGVSAAAIAGAAGTLATLAVSGLILAIMFAVLVVLPAVVVSRQALLNRPARDGGVEWYPPGLTLMWLAGAATIVFAVLVLAMAGDPGGLEGFTRAYLSRSLQGLMPGDAPPGSIDELAIPLARFLPGLVAVSWLFMSAVNAVLAQALLVRSGHNRRPSPRVADIELPSWLPVGAAIAAAGAFMPGFAGFVGANLLMIALAVSFFAGLAVIHTAAARWNNRLAWLTLMYTFTIVFTWPAVLIALLGIVETWTGLRQRFASGPPQS